VLEYQQPGEYTKRADKQEDLAVAALGTHSAEDKPGSWER
jgi:hypothetical protein